MRTALDTELFPDRCEVVEIPLHNQWVYLIQKKRKQRLKSSADKKQSCCVYQ